MKKKTSLFLKVALGIGVLSLSGTLIMNYIGGKVEKAKTPTYSMYDTVTVEKIDLETYTRGTGLFTSFNIANIRVDEGQKITRQYVEDGASVVANQNIFTVSNGFEASTLKTPIAGLFFEQQGENNNATYQVYDISNTGIMIQVSEANVVKLEVGQAAKVIFSATNDELDGEVSYISKVAQNGTFPVRIRIPYQASLRFGYNASARIITASKKDAICVPYNAVQFEGKKAFVILAKHKKQLNETGNITKEMKTYIQVGASDNDYVEVTEGLKENDKVLMGTYF